MCDTNIAATASSTTYDITLEQMAALIAENLKVPVESVEVKYRIEARYAFPDFECKYHVVTGVTAKVNNMAKDQTAPDDTSIVDRKYI